MKSFKVQLTFHGDLGFFLKRGSINPLRRELTERTSVKDIIESCGIPHTEVDLILVSDRPADFALVLDTPAMVHVYPPSSQPDAGFPGNRLQTRNVEKFVADGHLGKLVRDLRLLGIDIEYNRAADDRQLIETAQRGDRALLSRDRRLLTHSVVRHGYYVRSQDPLEQTGEILRRFDLKKAPFTRCLRCNARLEPVEKAEIVNRLEPLTKLYYQQFRRCTNCDQIYWPGSHFTRLETRLRQLAEFRVTQSCDFG